MKKQDKNMWIFVGLIALAGVLIYGGSQGWFKSTYTLTQQTVQMQPETPLTGFYASISLNPNPSCIGQPIDGRITSNMGNALCSIYFTNNQGRQLYKNVQLDNQGSYVETQTINIVGVVTFQAICFKDEKYKLTNSVALTTQACPNPPQPPEPPPQPQYTCTESDGGDNIAIKGWCQDDFHNLAYIELCEGGSGENKNLKEYYCEDGICKSKSYPCNYCEDGLCLAEDPDDNCVNSCDNIGYGSGRWLYDWTIAGDCYTSTFGFCNFPYPGGLNKQEVKTFNGASCCCWCCNLANTCH